MSVILAVDPGKVTGLALLDTSNGEFTVWQVDARGGAKESVSERVTSTVRSTLREYSFVPRIDVVVEDFVLRHGQAVDITPMHTIGAIDELANYSTYKYSPGNHKNGNKAYDISKMIKDSGFKLEGDHKADALSLSLHHWKIHDAVAALEFLEDYKK